MFNAKSYLASLELPTLVYEHDGKEETITGRIFSFNEGLLLQETFTDITSIEDLAEQDRQLRQKLVPLLCETCGFPQDVVDAMQHWPQSLIIEAYADFLASGLGTKKKATNE